MKSCFHIAEQLPKVQETLPVLPVSHAAQNVSSLSNFDESKNPLRMWVFSEGMKGIDGFVSLINAPQHRCERYLHADTLRIRTSATLNELREDPPDLLRLTIRLNQVKGFCNRSESILQSGRAVCPFCGLPIDATGHLCPRANGYRR